MARGDNAIWVFLTLQYGYDPYPNDEDNQNNWFYAKVEPTSGVPSFDGLPETARLLIVRHYPAEEPYRFSWIVKTKEDAIEERYNYAGDGGSQSWTEYNIDPSDVLAIAPFSPVFQRIPARVVIHPYNDTYRVNFVDTRTNKPVLWISVNWPYPTYSYESYILPQAESGDIRTKTDLAHATRHLLVSKADLNTTWKALNEKWQQYNIT